MKDYKDVARSVFRRRNEYLQEKKRKRDMLMKRTAVALSCSVMLLVGFNIWRNDALKSLAPSPDGSQFNVTEMDTTAPVTTDENGMTAPPEDNLPAVTTANSQGGKVSDHSGDPSVTTDSTAVTTTNKNSGSPAATEVNTTMSHMEITVTRSSAVTTSAASKTTAVKTASTAKTTTNHTTTTKGNAAAATTHQTTTVRPAATTTARQTTTVRTAATTTVRHTTTRVTATNSMQTTTTTKIKSTSPVNTTTARYTTTAKRTTTTGSPMTTTKSAGTQQHDEPVVATTTKTADIPATSSSSGMGGGAVPIPATTSPVVQPPSTTGFYRSDGKYFTTIGTVSDTSLVGLKTEVVNDNEHHATFTFREYSGLDKDVLCAVNVNNGSTYYLCINEAWFPQTLGDIITGLDLERYMEVNSIHDNDSGATRSADTNTLTELLKEYSSSPTSVSGITQNGYGEIYNKNGGTLNSPDNSNVRATIYFEYDAINGSSNYHYGILHITNDGKLYFDLLYLRYTYDIGTDAANEIISKLMS